MEDIQPLNNCEVFKQIRIEFTNYHQRVKKLNTFIYFGGNEQHIKELAKHLLNVLLEHGLVHQEEPEAMPTIAPGADIDQLRGTVMYLVLNSANLDGSTDEADLGRCNPQCVHLLQQLPAPLPQLLTVSMMLLCGLDEQLLELLACSQYWLATQYFDALNDALAHQVSAKEKTVSLICGALTAVTKSICYGNASSATLMDNAMRMVQRNLLDTEERQRVLGARMARIRYLGNAMTQLLDVLLAIMHSLNGDKPQLPNYSLVYTLRSPAMCKVEPATLDIVDAKLRLFAGKIMDFVQRLLLCVNVDTYIEWQEMPSGQLLFHLQAHISNQSKKLVELLDGDETLKTHSLRSMLDNFSEVAQTFDQRLEELELGELLGFLDGEMGDVYGEQLLAGLNELLKRSICFGNDECVEMMAKHVELLTKDHAMLILNHLSEVLKAQAQQKQMADFDESELEDLNEMYGDLVRQVLYTIYCFCSDVVDKLELLCHRDQLELLDHYNFELEDYSSRRIYFFNQLSDSIAQFPLHEFLELCWEQPKQTWLSLAQLAMTHGPYARLYWHVGSVVCESHARPYVPYTVEKLMQDERLLSQNLNIDLLLALYEQPVILNGMIYRRPNQLILNLNVSTVPYSEEELKSAHYVYLKSWANALEKYTMSKNYAAMEKLLQTLQRLPQVEQRIKQCSHKSLRLQLYRLSQLKKKPANPLNLRQIKQTRAKLRLARKYVALHDQFEVWRLGHWSVVAQLIFGMDQLRSTLANFEPERLAVLDLIMDIYNQNLPHSYIFCPYLLNNVKELVTNSLKHKQFWQDEQLALLLNTNKPTPVQEYVALLPLCSTLEAINLLSNAIRNSLDRAVMEDFSKAVDIANTTNSQNAYSFVFKCYMHAFEQKLITPAAYDDYPRLIEHLLQTPKLQMPQNLLAAVNNFMLLLKPTCGEMNKSQILEYVSQTLT